MSAHDDEFPRPARAWTGPDFSWTRSTPDSSSFGPAGTILASTALSDGVTSSGVLTIEALATEEAAPDHYGSPRYTAESRHAFGDTRCRFIRYEVRQDGPDSLVFDNSRQEIFCRITKSETEFPEARAKDIADLFNAALEKAQAPEISRLVIDVSTVEHRFLERLTEMGLLGSSPDDVATYLIIRGLDDLVRAGVLKPTAD